MFLFFSAFTYATGALGPVVGYALGALLLQFYVDVFSYKVDLSPAHPRWIGAWWGGFIICGFALFTIAVPFLMFPQVMLLKQICFVVHIFLLGPSLIQNFLWMYQVMSINNVLMYIDRAIGLQLHVKFYYS